MKSRQFKLPFAGRILLFILGFGAALLPLHAIRTGDIDASDHGIKIDITRSHDPVLFWTLVCVFSVLSAVLLYGAFMKRNADA
jgi:hypothetical protein